jgi:hypothetical protein
MSDEPLSESTEQETVDIVFADMTLEQMQNEAHPGSLWSVTRELEDLATQLETLGAQARRLYLTVGEHAAATDKR